MLNKQGPGKIDWTDWSFNPITGCKHGCPYCYMLRMEKRFPGIMEPAFKPEYLERFKSVRKVKAGDKIFVGSSGDMWGDWVKPSWIDAVLECTKNRPDVIFQFLTKNPKEYNNWNLSNYKNCWFGTTVDGTDRTRMNIDILIYTMNNNLTKFVSFEPLLEMPKIRIADMKFLDWIIIGADSTKGAKKPPIGWIQYLIDMAYEVGTPVWVKDNYGYPEVIKESFKGETNA